MVPKGWEDYTLSEITKWSSGGTPSKSSKEYWNGDIPWISASSMRGHYYSDSDLKITELAVSEKAKMADKDNILLLVRGSMLWNKIPVGITTRRVAFNQDVKCISPILSKLDIDFLLYWFLAKENQLMGMVTGTGIGAGKLDTNDLQSLNVLLPPLLEQQKIANILSTWDKAISTTERLIENSTQQKKALMQQLLTGKKRLLDNKGKRFEGEWEERKLSNLGSTFNGLTGKTKVDFGSGKKYIPYMNIFKNTFIDTDNLDYVNIDVDEKQNTVQFGDVFFTTSSETPEEVGMSSILLKKTKEPIYLNSFCFGFRLFEIDKVAPAFIGYILRSSHVRRKIAILAQGATRYNLSKVQLLKISIALPSLEEQQKIATVLTNADREIELLEQQLADLQQEKKALMQVLLTGKVRVLVNGEVA